MSVDRAALASAVLLAAAAPPSPLPLLVFVALVPLARAIETLPPGARGRRRAFRAGALHGAVYWGLTLLWMPQAALRVGAWAALGWLAVVSTLALLTGLATLTFHRLRAVGVATPLALALSWVGVEWLRTAWLGPFDFPWMGLALPLGALPSLIQGAAWIGEVGVAFAVAAANGAVALTLSRPKGARLLPAAVLLGALGVVAAAGRVRIERTDTMRVARALVIQPDVALADKRADPARALRLSLEAAERLIDGVGPRERGAVDLAVLPETAVPAALDGDDAAELRERVASWAGRLGVPVIVGAYGAGQGRGGNAVFVASDDPAEVWPSAWKTRLVPGVEWTPLGEDVVDRGERPLVLELPGGLRVAPLVCIESAGPEPSRAMVAEGAGFLVNVTNDAWLAGDAWWSRSAAFWQHPAHLAFRAVETGVGALRVANNGRSEVVDPFGRRTLVVPPFEPGVGSAEVVSLRAGAPFVTFGPWIGTLSLVAALALSLVPSSGRRG